MASTGDTSCHAPLALYVNCCHTDPSSNSHFAGATLAGEIIAGGGGAAGATLTGALIAGGGGAAGTETRAVLAATVRTGIVGACEKNCIAMGAAEQMARIVLNCTTMSASPSISHAVL